MISIAGVGRSHEDMRSVVFEVTRFFVSRHVSSRVVLVDRDLENLLIATLEGVLVANFPPGLDQELNTSALIRPPSCSRTVPQSPKRYRSLEAASVTDVLIQKCRR